VTWPSGLAAFTAGLLIALITAPVGVSGAVFLLPIQLSVLHVPNPAVTPTNLVFNVIAGPGALFRHRQHGSLNTALTRTLLAGTLPGVIIGAFIRVYAVPGPRIFRLIVAAVLLPLGLWLCWQAARPAHRRHIRPPLARSTIIGLGLLVGAVGGIYGVGGGSILGPVLAGRGLPIAQVAPAALTSTFVASIAGAATYGLIALTAGGDIAPRWTLGLLCGLGGLIGGYLGARLQPRLPETGLRALLGALATGLAVLYFAQAI
jgi:uncharacterized membrane protein YfcA